MGGKVCFRRKGKRWGSQNIAGHCHQTCCIQKFGDNIKQCFDFLLKVKVMGLKPGYLLKYLLL